MKIKIFYSNNMNERGDSERLLKQALQQCVAERVELDVTGDDENKDIRIARPARGKPYAENASWLEFSVTHTGSMWICSAAQAAALPHAVPPLLGIDAEYADRRILRPEKIAERYFSEKEKAYVQERAAASCRGAVFAENTRRPCSEPTAPDHPPASADAGTCTRGSRKGSACAPAPARAPFIKTWTIKEAYLKALGTGITDDAGKYCALSDKHARFVSDERMEAVERELSAAAGRQLIISLCIMPPDGAQMEDKAPELEILRLY